MKNLKTYIGLSAIALSMCLASCSDDDEPSYSSKTMADSALKTILLQKGYQFNESGNLYLDDLARNTTVLDLSGTRLEASALSGLDIFPNLTEVNLADNGYGETFDFSVLPAQITGVDLTGNEIYDFEGLVSASVVNDEVQASILHTLTKLYLPASAKYNVEDLMPFYTQNQAEGRTVDMQMADDNGTLQAYTTLREIPDEYFRAYLKTIYPSLFVTDTQIDISKPLGLEERGQSISLIWESDTETIQSIEGVEYFINNPYYPSFYVALTCANPCSVSYIAPRSNLKCVWLSNVSTPLGVDFSQATNVSRVQFENNEYLISLDLSNTSIGTQELSELDINLGNGMSITHCANLEEIVLPESANGVIDDFILGDLPKLKKIDFSAITAAQGFYLFLPADCEINYPMNLAYRFATGSWELLPLEDGVTLIEIAITEEMSGMESTKNFILKYRSCLEDGYSSAYRREFGAYRWSRDSQFNN